MAKDMVEGSSALKEKKYNIITIEATKLPSQHELRVAAYARVSSDSDDQENSFAAQVGYYTDLIGSTGAWQMVDVYADEGITGTSIDKRDDFKRMLSDCRKGLIDRIIIKSISRFARNAKECLETVRELRSLGVSVFFEEQNLDTGNMSSEFLLAVQACFAQSESENISKNQKWGIHKRIQMGTYLPGSQPFGYYLDDKEIRIDPARAKYVRETFAMYLQGKNSQEIADYLSAQQALHPELCGTVWNDKRVLRLLQNEKYIGNSLWQKQYMTETLPRKLKNNKGEVERYYAVGTHPAIVSEAVFQRTQELINKRASHGSISAEAANSPLQGKLVCQHCGKKLRRKTARGKHYRTCRVHDVTPELCVLTPVAESTIENAFLRLYYKLKQSDILTLLFADLLSIREKRMLWRADIIALNKEISDLSRQNQMLAELKKQSLIDPDIFMSQGNNLARQLREVKLKKERLMASTADDTVERTQELIEVLESSPDFLDSFDAELFGELVERGLVDSNEEIRFILKNGLELPEMIERTVR